MSFSATKSMIALLLVLCFAFAVLPAAASEQSDERGVNTGVTIDTDPAGGYSGDYVVIYNPSSNVSTAASTGSLEGRIVTDISASMLHAHWEEAPSEAVPVNEDIPYIIDVDHEMSLLDLSDIPVSREPHVKGTSYPVGAKHDFTLMGYAPGDSMTTSYEFVALYVGAHCTIWPTTNADYHPLDGINEDYARIAAERFDEKFELMQAAYGDFSDTNGDGKVNLLFIISTTAGSPVRATSRGSSSPTI